VPQHADGHWNSCAREFATEAADEVTDLSFEYLLRYAQESAWREDARRTDNGAQIRRVAELALKRGPSVDFCGYWQRHVKAA
jgi:hypothetical protein